MDVCLPSKLVPVTFCLSTLQPNNEHNLLRLSATPHTPNLVPSTFLALPADFALDTSNSHFYITMIRKTVPGAVSLLSTCRLIRKETLPIIDPLLRILEQEPIRLVVDYPGLVATYHPLREPVAPIISPVSPLCRAFLMHTRTTMTGRHQVEIALVSGGRVLSCTFRCDQEASASVARSPEIGDLVLRVV
jgi:hypothetical protein